MKIIARLRVLLYLVCNGLILFLSSCNPTDPKTYSLFFMTDEDKQYIWQTNILDTGEVYPIQQGVLLSHPPRIWYYMLVRSGFYYYVDPKSEYLIKSQIKDDEFVRLDSIYLENFSYPDNALFLDDHTLFIINHSVGKGKKQYARVNVEQMEATIGDLPLPIPENPFDNMSVGLVYKRDSTLFIGYTYHYTNADGYGSADTVYIANLRYADMSLHHIDKDARSTYPGNVNTAQQNTFEAENGDFYFMTAPGIARGANPHQPTAIYRIKAQNQHIDTTYFYNISSAIGNHAYGMWYLGDHKALIRSERKDLFNTFKDHYRLPHIEFYVVDLLHNTPPEKLDLPLDRGSSRTCVLVENGIAYITINDGNRNNDVWIYNIVDNTLKKGLHIKGEIDYILRLDTL
ncbi:hypothetical protein G5B30_15710 [Sphingobacterium sp. SGG-5]|uniref:hypothetical protein n=1 Tax=Sphingobacterium sp. SGG-5 TaxID=2710881 RepID=UPI0013EB3B53|nr:hypothetical protein [Sphingobacterium sp. SGG-5]NGM63356.1 hypothetical protein [Sphingobacterium sp. SGG-5]